MSLIESNISILFFNAEDAKDTEYEKYPKSLRVLRVLRVKLKIRVPHEQTR